MHELEPPKFAKSPECSLRDSCEGASRGDYQVKAGITMGS